MATPRTGPHHRRHPEPGDFTQALVRRKLLSGDRYVCGIRSGTEVFEGAPRLDAAPYSVHIGLS